MAANMENQIFFGEVKVVKFALNSNVIVCRRKTTPKERDDVKDLASHVENLPNESTITINTMYAVNLENKWYRARQKFIRKTDSVPVFTLLDTQANVDFVDDLVVRKITSPHILAIKPFYFKLFIYAIGEFVYDDEFCLVFNQMIKDKILLAIYALIENKENVIHECYAGDVFYRDYRSKQLMSFRDLLIDLHLTYPSRVRELLNSGIFMARRMAMEMQNNADRTLVNEMSGLRMQSTLNSMMAVSTVNGLSLQPDNSVTGFDQFKEFIVNRYMTLGVIGEGGVCLLRIFIQIFP